MSKQSLFHYNLQLDDYAEFLPPAMDFCGTDLPNNPTAAKGGNKDSKDFLKS